ncbi:CPBP family intramembrane metalloprotease [Haloplanus rubicundus]|uniref:CPBP family intramembrane metalloprotease n=1 Tax=Haloplanus rubicundus TaxID=1547898 RepID=A0A345E8P8_9EURY|nr:CPBP family intramembrane glutamic endopeptidase [Haloplanus rubicundus]AXG05244.1 CPBP family intramembrane metalloprotease [Haloplanus rubicundus]AXG08570.1 CPBP family intramembrane metalloprotease [Haloplanus rubicundus]
MSLRGVLWNDAERRPRALLRVVLLIVVAALLAIGTSVGAAVGFGALRSWLSTAFGEAVATTLVAVVGVALTGGTVTLAVLIAGRYVDRRRVRDFGLRIDRGWWLDCGFGLALGAGLLTLVFLVGLAFGWLRVTGTLQPRAGFAVRFAGLVAIFVAVGVYEELLLRGYLLTNAAEGLVGWLGDRGAVVGATALSSLVFGLAHANNPNATLLSTLAIVLAGVMLAVGYVLTGDLAVPIGLHTTWNLFQGGVYGFPVSGLGVGASVVAVEETGPDVVTGGAFGPEAGLLGLGAMIVGTVAIAVWVRWRTGELRIDPAVTTPELRGDSGDAETPVDTDRWEPAPGDRE